MIFSSSLQLGENELKAVIIGAGAQGRVALDLLLDCADYEEYEFLDDNEALWGTDLNGISIRGGVALVENYDKKKFRAILAFGNPKLRVLLSKSKSLLTVPFMNLIHPSAYIARSAQFGVGSTVCAQAIVNSNSVVGNHVLVNNAALIEHDSVLSDFTTVCPGASVGGRSELLEGAFICSGAVLLPRVRIGRNSVVAAGSLVTRDVPDSVLVMGVPARIKCEINDTFDFKKLL